ncbi:DEKNAAC100926 [Brettanomyces naardenensis]|uniref:DEKNAAC100926 n=1 Tax=Brettanomyces naardenensis TaxID=13370 RepID=A0A448YGX6_BRENA|nr:DEKNAAC100926 [Brettanomyces naardenensis]
MAPTGLSMFYVSTIVSQLVYSLGGSAFKAGIGSEMIEVTPFFHQMATSIMYSMGEDNQAGVLATTMVTFAFSSIITGICFGLLGKFRLGKLVGFFPRHILVGCVGGVGYFLVVTAVEVCSRIDGGIQYNWDTMKYLFQPLVLLQWVFPLSLTFLLVVAQHLIRSPLLVPGYIILVFVGFHLLIALVPQWNLQSAREYGWIFPLQQSQEPWWSFYKLYSFSKVDWWLVISQIPTIFALTFFGVLHVPINVPALALSTGTDAVDVDRELLAHGVSNVLSGLAGSIQNYLVYTNSVLFIRAGADSRLSGVLLAMATVCVMCSGPAIIGYIPVCVVGVLVFLLGYELVKEALWDTWGRVRPFEYTTIAVIVATMGAVDFVVGILVGILLACVSFVVQASSEEVVTGIYSGEYARSIVVRHPKQLEFLERVGRQTCVFKLTGSLFFGSIGGLEEKVRSRFARQSWQREPVKFLILDANRVSGIDFSAAEGFRRIRNLVVEKGCYLLISSVDQGSAIVRALEDCGLWETEEHRERVQLFNNLNSALEWSENRFLADVAELAGSRSNSKRAISFSANVPTGAIPARSPSFSDKNPLLLPRDPSFPGQPNNRVPLLFGLSPSDHLSMLSGSPRHVQLLSAAQKSLTAERQDILLAKSTASAHSRPLPLLLKVMQGLSDTLNESLWAKLCPYLQQLEFQPGDMVYNRNVDPPAVFFVEQGLIDYEISFNNLQFSLKSSVLPLTMFGEIVKTRSDRKLVYTASTRSVLWKLDRDSIERLRIENTQVYEQLLAVCLRLASQRYDATTSNILVSL